MMKKLFSFFCILTALTLVLCSCSGKNVTAENTTSPGGKSGTSAAAGGDIFMPFAEKDGFDPYQVENVLNKRLCRLLYDGLVSLDGAYEPVYEIASDCTSSGVTLTVTLNPAAQFSSGDVVTPADVVYSFDLAKKNDAYAERLSNFDSAAESGNAVVFSLGEPDCFAVNCLTFPIIRPTEKDGVPLGTGRYSVIYDAGKPVLLKNSHKKGFEPKLSRIELVEPKTNDEILTALEIGSVSYYYDDLSSGSYTRFNAQPNDVLLNNLVYLGINGENTELASPLFRRAVNSLIDREEIASAAYQGHARAAFTPFNPAWSKLGDGKMIVTENKTTAELLKLSDVDTASLSLKLIVNSGNSFRLEAAKTIAAALTAGGIKTNVTEVAFEDYLTLLRLGEYDLYIGEVKLTDNMDISPLFDGGECGYGLTEETQRRSFERYTQLKNGDCQLIDFINTFSTELPFIPLCYRCGSIFFPNMLVSGGAVISENDLFRGIENWTFS